MLNLHWQLNEHILGIYIDSLGASWGKFLVHWQVAGAHFSSGLALSTVRVTVTWWYPQHTGDKDRVGLICYDTVSPS